MDQRGKDEFEEWRPVRGMEWLLEVSSLGRVRRIDSQSLLKSSLDGRGYCSPIATVRGKRHRISAHRAVAEAFLGACPIGYEVNHIDGCKSNNRVDNLEYVCRSDNLRHAVATGLCKRQVKLTPEQVFEIKRLSKTTKQCVLAELYGVHNSQINKIVKGKKWGWLRQSACPTVSESKH